MKRNKKLTTMLTAYLYPSPAALLLAKAAPPNMSFSDIISEFLRPGACEIPSPAALRRAKAAPPLLAGSKAAPPLLAKLREDVELCYRKSNAPTGKDRENEPIMEAFAGLFGGAAKAKADARVMRERTRLKARRRAERRQKFTGKYVTHSGDELVIAEMNTMHIFYTARMIWNHRVLAFARFDTFDGKPMKAHDDVRRWSKDYCQAAFNALMAELSTRNWDELPGEARSQFTGMKALSNFVTLY